MALPIIDLLEMIQIHHGQGQAIAQPFTALDFQVQHLVQMLPIEGPVNGSCVLSALTRSMAPTAKDANNDTTPFKDRFRVQCEKEPSTTVVAHIAKDGHYCIHYDPVRSNRFWCWAKFKGMRRAVWSLVTAARAWISPMGAQGSSPKRPNIDRSFQNDYDGVFASNSTSFTPCHGPAHLIPTSP